MSSIAESQRGLERPARGLAVVRDHAQHLPVIHVPLMMSYPKRFKEAKRIEDVVQLLRSAHPPRRPVEHPAAEVGEALGVGERRAAALQLLDAFAKVWVPELSYFAVFLPMAIVLVLRPHGLLGRPA